VDKKTTLDRYFAASGARMRWRRAAGTSPSRR